MAQAQITTAVNQGIQKLASLDSQASSAVAKLKQGFLDDDFKIINSAYQDLQDATQAKTQTLKDIQDVIKNHVEETTAKLNQQKAQLELDTAAINNIAQSALSASMKLDGTLDLDMIQQIADENGLDPNALYGAIQKAQKDEVIFQQGETKFASDQLQAAAQLDSTKQATSTAKANESLIRANIDKVKADTALVNGTGGVTTALASQPGYSKLTSAQKTIADGTNNLINALQAYKDLYKEKTDKSGGNYFGADAAELSSAYHSLIFQFSVAAGSGAIQKADAEQIEQIIPDPTSVSGITSAALKGGQKGGLKALETQIEKFSNNLKSYGLKPTDTSTPVPVVVPNPSGGEDIEITD